MANDQSQTTADDAPRKFKAPWREDDDEFNTLGTYYEIARIFNGKLCALLERWLNLDGDNHDVEALIHETREAVKSRHDQ